MSRIVAGTAGGRRLRTPPGDRTRPTTDRVREALFASLLSELGPLDGLRVLDLYAGSGAVGLEALSRGAAEVELVEHDAKACDVVRDNVRAVGLPGARVVRSTVERYLVRAPERPFDVVFADPPYDLGAEEVDAVLAALAEPGRLADGAVVVLERRKRSAPPTWPDGLEPTRDKRYGESVLCYGRRHA